MRVWVLVCVCFGGACVGVRVLARVCVGACMLVRVCVWVPVCVRVLAHVCS